MKTEATPASYLADLGTAQARISSAQRQLEVARTSPATCIQWAGIRSGLALLEAACNVLSGLDREFREQHEAHDLHSAELADELRGRA
jgi:hypothetical protein